MFLAEQWIFSELLKKQKNERKNGKNGKKMAKKEKKLHGLHLRLGGTRVGVEGRSKEAEVAFGEALAFLK